VILGYITLPTRGEKNNRYSFSEFFDSIEKTIFSLYCADKFNLVNFIFGYRVFRSVREFDALVLHDDLHYRGLDCHGWKEYGRDDSDSVSTQRPDFTK